MQKVLVSLVAAVVMAVGAHNASAEIEIVVAPSVVSLDSQGQLVTVHTNLPYSQVIGASVLLEDVEIDWWKADNRGNFVAKFVLDDVKDLVERILDPRNSGEVELEMKGTTVGGEPFFGTDTIRVVAPKR